METRESFGKPCRIFAFQQRALEQGRDHMALFPQGMQIPQKDKLLKEDKLDRSSILEEDKLNPWLFPQSLRVQQRCFTFTANGFIALLRIIGDIQSLLLTLMCNIASTYFSKKSAGPAISDQIEQSRRCCFIDSAILICKLQHLNPNVPIKTQIELIMAMHDLLAEYGLCCASGDGETEEGTFLKFAIKHLLSLDMKLKSNFHSLNKGFETMQCDEQLSHNNHVEISDRVNVASDTVNVAIDKGNIVEKDVLEGVPSKGILSYESMEKENTGLECSKCSGDEPNGMSHGEKASKQFNDLGSELTEDERDELEPPDNVLAGHAIDKFLDDPNLCEDKLSEVAGSDGFLDSIMKIIFPDNGNLKQLKASSLGSSDPYLEVYCNLYYLLAQSEEMSATDKWAGFVLTKEGEEFVEQNANLFKYDLQYNPLCFESWQWLANVNDETSHGFMYAGGGLLLNDGSKQINVIGWRKNSTLPHRVETSHRRSWRCLLMTLALTKTSAQQVPLSPEDWSHAFYLGKLSEKLGYSHEMSFSYYDKAIDLNPSAVDAVYRMHASRLKLKLLCTCGKQNREAVKVVAEYSFGESTKKNVMKILS
ncbi:hypothetical protein ACSBR2_038470 [Camellia fascicularis]